MKSRFCFAILLLVLTPGLALADTVWLNSLGDQDYANAANWNNGVPGVVDGAVAQINPGAAGPIVNSAANPYTWGYSIGHTGAGTAEMTVNAGADLTSSWFGLGWSDGGGAGDADGILNVDGGVLTVYDDFLVGADGNGNGTINMTNGIIYTNRLWVGNFGGVGQINLDAGIIALVVAGGGIALNPGSNIDLELGELHHYGDAVAGFNGLIGSGLITAYDGTGIAVAEYVADGDYTRVYAVPEPTTMMLLGLGGILLRRKK